jgi:hypothetical protein
MYNVILQDDGTHAPWCNCPRCGENAISREEINKKFGTRVMANKKRIPQSNCRDCRSEERKDPVKQKDIFTKEERDIIRKGKSLFMPWRYEDLDRFYYIIAHAAPNVKYVY